MKRLEPSSAAPRQDTVQLTDNVESGSSEMKAVLKANIYFMRDLLAIGESIGNPYAIIKFLPVDPKVPVKMVTYCLTVQSDFIVLLKNAKSKEPVIIRPVYFLGAVGEALVINAVVRDKVH